MKCIQKLAMIPDQLWEPAYDADRRIQPGAWVAEITALSTCPPGRRDGADRA